MSLYEKLNEIKTEVWKMAASQREQKYSLPEYIRRINRKLVDLGLTLTWDLDVDRSQSGYDPDDQAWQYDGVILFTITSAEDGDYLDCNWFISGTGKTQAEAFKYAMLGAKEMFLLYFFDVPQKELDPVAMIRSDYEEREKLRAKKLKTILDQIHLEIQQALFENPEMRKPIDDLVSQYVRVRGKPSPTYYAIETLEVAEALHAALGKLLHPDVV